MKVVLKHRDRKGFLVSDYVRMRLIVDPASAYNTTEQIEFTNKLDVRYVFQFSAQRLRAKEFDSEQAALLYLDALLEHVRLWEQTHPGVEHTLAHKCRVFIDGLYAETA